MEKTIFIVLLAVSLFVTPAANATVEIRGSLWDQTGAKPEFWDAGNFAGFWLNPAGNESTEVLMAKDPSLATRSIAPKHLSYQTKAVVHKYNLNAVNVAVENGIDCTTGKKSKSGGCYMRVGWLGELYVSLDGQSKVSQILLEHKRETKNLTVGESWRVGNWTLVLQSIDATTEPRQAWFTLWYNGQKLDDKVISTGQAYTYIEKSIAGESDVPMFVTYIDSVFSGASTGMVQLKFTWVISRDVAEIKAGDKIGVFEVEEANERIVLRNEKEVGLGQNTLVDLAGNIKFKVADSPLLRFQPVKLVATGFTPVASVVTPAPALMETPISVTATPAATPAATQTPAMTTVQKDTPEPKSFRSPVKKALGFWGTYAIIGIVVLAYLVLRKGKGG